MNFFLTLAYLFFIGSVSGWVLELFFRKFFSASNPEHKWINPGFCTGPYLPIYGFGLCALYLLALLGRETGLDGSIQGRALLFLGMAVSMTLIVKVENLKAHIQAAQERASTRVHFFFAFRSERPLVEHLREAHEAMERIKQKSKTDKIG